jgi:hypothetical protein
MLDHNTKDDYVRGVDLTIDLRNLSDKMLDRLYQLIDTRKKATIVSAYLEGATNYQVDRFFEFGFTQSEYEFAFSLVLRYSDGDIYAGNTIPQEYFINNNLEDLLEYAIKWHNSLPAKDDYDARNHRNKEYQTYLELKSKYEGIENE